MMMKLLRFLLFVVPVISFSLNRLSRRDLLQSSLLVGLPLPAGATQDFSLYQDSGFGLRVPSDWVFSEQKLFDRRRLLVWNDPSDPKTGLFIAYSPVRDDFTSLGSIGSVEQVAEQTIRPKGTLADEKTENKSVMLSAVSKKQAYFFDYRQSVGELQPETHFRTVFTLQPGTAAGNVLVSITAQTPEARYASIKPTIDAIIDSYGRQ